MQSVLQKMLAQLSEEDKLSFTELAKKLNAANGDVSQLSAQDKALIAVMEQKYDSQLATVAPTQTTSQPNDDFLKLPFGLLIREILARDLGEKFPLEEEAVAFAFNNKWCPLECLDDSLALSVFEQFKEDITNINAWRNSVVDVNEDKKMSVGLAWFMVVYQLNQRLNT